MNNIRLVIADVDGTLVTQDKVLTARAIEAVKRLRNAGIAFTLTSGRPPLGIKMLIQMGNASSDVQRQAKFVTTSNEEEGFANAMEALVLREHDFIGKAS